MTESTPLFCIVKNHEEQYAVWPADLAVPAGWTVEGGARPKQECLDEIDVLWVDMRPASLRRQMSN
jgi:MbtH protein